MEHSHRALPSLDELRRLHVLAGLKLLDTAPEPAFDNLAMLARRLTGAPVGLLSLVDSHRQWFKARSGFEPTETSRDVAFCSQAIESSEIMIGEDARRDPRFANNPLVTGEPGIMFYAGAPLLVRGENQGTPVAIGTVCVIDYEPRILTDDQQAALQELANVAVNLIEGRQLAITAVDQAKEQELLTHQLVYEQRKFQQAERMANLGYWRLDLKDERVHWSDQVFVIHGLPVSDGPPLSSAYDFYPPHAKAVVTGALAKTIETHEGFDIETDLLTAQGMLRRVRSIGELEVVDGRPAAVFGVFQDVTDRYQMEQILRRSAYSDSLTGLPNRAALDAELEVRIGNAVATDGGLAVMLVDLDGFKAVNDAQGHVAGDELLQVVAQRLSSPALKDCFVARLGGDEFVVIPNFGCNLRSLETHARQILCDLSLPIVTDDCNTTISGTIGIACLQAGDTRCALMRRADQALYAAKNSERGTAHIYGSRRVIRPYEAPRSRAS